MRNLWEYICLNFKVSIGTTNSDTLHCDPNHNFILIAQMLPISKDNSLLQEGKCNEILDLDVGSRGEQEVDWKHSDGILRAQQIPEISGTFGTTYSAAES